MTFIKNTSVCLIVILLISLGFADVYAQEMRVDVSVKGLKSDFSEQGLKISDLALMELTPHNEFVEIRGFQVQLSRGTRLVKERKVAGSQFDLRRLKSKARPGDRIVIEIDMINKTQNAMPVKYVMTFPII